MPILLKTWVECTAKTPLPRRRARDGSLCGFRGAAERVPTRGLKTGRCANVRDRCGHGKRRKNGCRRISAEGEAASGEAAGYGFVKG